VKVANLLQRQLGVKVGRGQKAAIRAKQLEYSIGLLNSLVPSGRQDVQGLGSKINGSHSGAGNLTERLLVSLVIIRR
jgi:hypothetical protein